MHFLSIAPHSAAPEVSRTVWLAKCLYAHFCSAAAQKRSASSANSLY